MRGKTFVLTEYVEPVSRIVSSLEEEEIVSGISDVFKALDFLHARCKLSHNNVSPKSLFFSRKALCWKLGCTQLMSSPDEETFDFVKRMVVYKQLNSTHSFMAPEDRSLETCEPIPSVHEIHRRDSFAAGCLIQTLLPRLKDSQMVQMLTSVQKDNRLELGPLLQSHDLFTECSFHSLKESLVSFGSFTESEKKSFVTSEVIEMMRKISPKLLASTVIPMMLTNRLLMLHPESRVLLHAHLFVPNPFPCHPISEHLVSRPLFERYVIPVIIKLFSVRKIKLRLILLQFLPFYAPLIDRQVMYNTVAPLISLGLEDENDDILSATYAALSTLVQVFGGEILSGTKKKRRKVFCNDVPRSSLSSSSHAVSSLARDHVTPDSRNGVDCHEAERRGKDSCVRMDGWHGEWGSSPSSSPTSVSHIHAQDVNAEEDQSIGENGSADGRVGTNVISNVRQEKSIKSWKKRSGVQELDIKAIEIQVPEEVEDLFSEMEPRVNFPAEASHDRKFRVNSHSGQRTKKDLFALKDELERDGDEGDWSNDDDNWIQDEDREHEHDTSPQQMHTTSSINELS